jgi:hypothetical protein
MNISPWDCEMRGLGTASRELVCGPDPSGRDSDCISPLLLFVYRLGSIHSYQALLHPPYPVATGDSCIFLCCVDVIL